MNKNQKKNIGQEIKSDMTRKKVISLLGSIPYSSIEQRNKIVCALIGHSKISTYCFGYRYCGRCGALVGDSLGGSDYGKLKAVIIGHICSLCKKNYKMCTWKDKLYVANPFRGRKQ